ncbi:hypothetical protein [Gracilimonas sediminicola]|uniref:Uncharacterized protein n=1 Tax=Gracilimonas sediminicola TaxID=2952158 RepID=A0A9X2L584_9BACT|nr:hypothetical protein [Gracilimonas sediminicola]MCP9292562.1 hypothetical protein [Gracilimonas sediminicola]
MIKKIPIVLWFYQAISLFFIIAHAAGAYSYVVELFSSFTTTNFLGTALNFLALVFICTVIVGIWKRKVFAKFGAVFHSFLLFILAIYISIRGYLEFAPEDIYYQIGYVAFYLLFTGTFLSIPLIIWKSKQVNKFFTEPNRLA